MAKCDAETSNRSLGYIIRAIDRSSTGEQLEAVALRIRNYRLTNEDYKIAVFLFNVAEAELLKKTNKSVDSEPLPVVI